MIVLFLAPSVHRLFGKADRLMRETFPDAVHVETADALESQPRADLIVSFLSPVIVPPRFLGCETVNFHPAPPDYPGRGSASIALYEGASHFGATAHRMAAKVDTGDIVLTRRFPVSSDDGCDRLFARAEDLCLDLLGEILAFYRQHRRLPPPNGERWTRRAMTRKEFEQWLILDPSDPADMERKIRAARHPRFPGPYLIVNGRRFALYER